MMLAGEFNFFEKLNFWKKDWQKNLLLLIDGTIFYKNA